MAERWISFFFQAEDGIRDLVRSRGLGDVYKRQLEDDIVGPPGGEDLESAGVGGIHQAALALDDDDAVSYTHLTLPTSDLV